MESDAGISPTVLSSAKVNRKDESAEITSVTDVFGVPGRVTKKAKQI